MVAQVERVVIVRSDRRATSLGKCELCIYRPTRYWAVQFDNPLLAVTVYKKGALAIQEWLC